MDQLVAATAPWANFYSGSSLVQNAVTFGHLGGMVMSGGLAIATDRSVVGKASVSPEERRRHLKAASGTHRWVILGLGITMITGALMLAADLEYLIVSRAFWIKMGLLGLLLANGLFITRQEGVVSSTHPALTRHWRRLRRLSMTSFLLWFAVVLAGVAMGNA